MSRKWRDDRNLLFFKKYSITKGKKNANYFSRSNALRWNALQGGSASPVRDREML